MDAIPSYNRDVRGTRRSPKNITKEKHHMNTKLASMEAQIRFLDAITYNVEKMAYVYAANGAVVALEEFSKYDCENIIPAHQKAAFDKETEELLSTRSTGYSDEMLAEMRNVWGEGETIVNVMTGETITL